MTQIARQQRNARKRVRSENRPRRRKQRRGVLLIVVLSLLVLFALIGLTFVVVAGQYDRAARSMAQNELTDDQGPQLLDQALYDLLRGPVVNDPLLAHASAIYSLDNDSDGAIDEDPVNGVDDDNDGRIDEDPPGGIASSLLEDFYGGDAVVGKTTSFGFGIVNGDYLYMAVEPGVLDTRRNAYVGRVLTFTSGSAQGKSTRIVYSGKLPPANFLTVLVVEALDNPGGPAHQMPSVNSQFIINGRPFSGVEGAEADESYDAPDALNPFLAFVPADFPNTPMIPSFVDRLLDLNGDGLPDIVIDNDRDGFNDSGWMNFGFEIKTAADGRRIRPMVAVMIQDMDGRVNLNAHGNLAQISTVNADYGIPHPGPLAGGGPLNGPPGSGFGPADINLRGVFGNEAKYLAFLQSRYGANGKPGGASTSDLWRLIGQGIPNGYVQPTTPNFDNNKEYGSHPDVLGGGLLGVDSAGRPVMFNAGIASEFNDSPYQINLVKPDGLDSPYTVFEMERLLRWNDVDRNSLPAIWNRHPSLAPGDFGSLSLRRQITTLGSHAPVPYGPADIRDMMAERITAAGGLTDTKTEDNEITRLIPFEILHGGKMNVNRVWGNGADDNSNHVVDDIQELAAAEQVYGGVSAYMTPVPADYLNGITLGRTIPETGPAHDQSKGRYLYARQLFTLTMLVTDGNYKIPPSAEVGLTDANRRELAIRRMAQWAINCVDFRDPDAIMTPFEYDVNPFNGWDVDGDLRTEEVDPADNMLPHPDRRVVWGMEYPDLLLTETLAFHNRRMRDTEWDNGNQAADANEDDHDFGDGIPRGTKRIHPAYDPADTPPKNGDQTLDQVRIPEGSLFLEFYCTRNTAANNPVLPQELYTSGKLDLGRAVGGYPVWRLAISRSHHNAGAGAPRAPQSPNQRRLTHPDTTAYQPNHPGPVYPSEQMSLIDPAPNLEIERYVWFSAAVPPAATTNNEMNAENTFYNRTGAAGAQLPPGQYLVVGPRDRTVISSKPDTDPLSPITVDGDQFIDLSAASFAYQDTAANAYPPGAVAGKIITPVQKMVAAIDAPTYLGDVRGLNVSEPLPVSPAAGAPYPVPMHPRESYGNMTAAGLYLDDPLDKAAGRPLTELSDTLDDTQKTQKVEEYRTVFLQRTANPLQRWNPAAGHNEHDATLPVNPYITVDWQPVDLTVFNGEDRSEWSNATVADHGEFDPDDPDADWQDGGAADPRFGTRQRKDLASAQNLWAPTSESQTHIGARQDTEDDFFQFNLLHTLGYLNASYGAPSPSPSLGDPADGPFPWLTWPNRPFVSHYELMLVPASSQSRILSEFTRAQTGVSPYADAKGMFGHLLNFYHGTSATAGEPPAHFYRVLEYLEVPSRFVGADRWYAPTISNFEPTIKFALAPNNAHQFLAPFNRLSRHRDPGRVNANTMPGAGVWQAIDNNGDTAGSGFATFAQIDAARRGTVDVFGRFTTPFRGSVFASSATGITRSSPQFSLLRPNPATLATLPLPLLGPPSSTAAHNDPAHNAYFRMQGLQRLGNLVSTQSNVFAIWLTVGYFEVDNAGNPVRELGQDTGEIVRHRGFYIVDRSIPVAFQRGRNHNVDNTILVRRFIE